MTTYPGFLLIISVDTLLAIFFGMTSLQAQESFPDIRSVKADLEVPDLAEGPAAAGARIRQAHPDWAKTGVYHTLFLPRDWKPGNSKALLPVLVELPGNGGFQSRQGDTCEGRPEGCKLGYGISGGKGFIWVSLPFVNGAGDDLALNWWGDKPTHDPKPTVAYAKAVVPWVCAEFGGDPDRVVLLGFSRGAIASNFIGLQDDEIAKLWRAFVAYSHYDGVKTWSYPGSGRPAAAERLRRLGVRPQFICHEGAGVEATRAYLESTGIDGQFTFSTTGFLNHNDAWTLRPSKARTELRKWLRDVLGD